MEPIRIPPDVAQVLSALEEDGHAAYVVGGCVRDSLLGRTPQDWDVCTSALPAEMKACFHARGLRTVDTGIRHGTVTVCLPAGTQYEVTTFRRDGPYADHRHPDRVEFVDRVETDLARRDFTMNAMAYHPNFGLIDPFGGAAALRARTIACVGAPRERFREDALRILRAMRFAAVYGFSVAPETAAAMHGEADALAQVAAERIWKELEKLLGGVAVTPVLLSFRDVLERLLPALAAFSAAAYEAAARALARDRGDDPAVRLALLLAYAPDDGAASLDRLRLDRATRAQTLALLALRPARLADAPARRWLRRLGAAPFFQLLAVRAAQGDPAAPALRREAEAVLRDGLCVSRENLAVTGRDLAAAGIPPGPQLGAALSLLLDRVVDGEVENTREALLRAAAALCRPEGAP